MEDSEIIELYWQRSECAIEETKKKYEPLLISVASQILPDFQDVEECINDTYLGAWHAMPDARPSFLSAFLCRITKNLAWKRHDYLSAEKRSCHADIPISELEHALSAKRTEYPYEAQELAQAISAFLKTQNDKSRRIFVQRYYFYTSIDEIAARFNSRPGSVKSTLSRTRKRLKKYLEKEGLIG